MELGSKVGSVYAGEEAWGSTGDHPGPWYGPLILFCTICKLRGSQPCKGRKMEARL